MGSPSQGPLVPLCRSLACSPSYAAPPPTSSTLRFSLLPGVPDSDRPFSADVLPWPDSYISTVGLTFPLFLCLKHPAKTKFPIVSSRTKLLVPLSIPSRQWHVHSAQAPKGHPQHVARSSWPHISHQVIRPYLPTAVTGPSLCTHCQSPGSLLISPARSIYPATSRCPVHISAISRLPPRNPFSTW